MSPLCLLPSYTRWSTGVGISRTMVGCPLLTHSRRTLLNLWMEGRDIAVQTYIYARLSVSVRVCVCMCNICGPLLSPCLPGCMLFCLLSSVLKLPKRGLVLHRPLCHCWLISPLESWGAVHLGGGGKEPSCLKVISCDCKGWGRGSLGGQGASWGLVSPYTAPQMPLLPETQAQANKRFSVSFWWWLSFEV